MRLFEKRLLFAWLVGVPFSYFIAAFLENFYQTPIEIAAWTVLVHALVSLLVYYLAGKFIKDLRANFTEALLASILFAALLVFVVAMYFMAKPFNTIFDSAVFQLSKKTWLAFAAALIPALPLLAWTLNKARQNRWRETRLFRALDANVYGWMVALLFFAVYLIFASIFNRPAYDADDIFFDADGNLYRWRFATEKYRDYYWRPAHPFILLIVRPLVMGLAFLFKGDALFAAFTFNALVGAACVYLVWYFVKQAVGNPLYALLIAALFGASSTQLAFGSIIESYIYLSAAALLFLVILLKDKPLYMQVVAGLLSFGITISNIAQTLIAHFFVKRNLKQIIVYGLIVGALAVPLSLLNNWVYPNSQPYFWELSTLGGEGHNQFPATFQRANLMARVMALHSFVAPQPLVIRDGFPFPKTWMFRAAIKKEPMQLATYETPLGNGLARLWVGMLLLGGALFFKNIFKQDNGYSFAFIFTVLFFFLLYLQYGKDVFLYSANWTYAILLFLALAWRELASKRWFQIFLLAFVLFLLVNNAQMLYAMMKNSAPSVPFPVWR
ncbi:MAG: hypothetical protein Fur002_09640 [Anaerolineales bacterium]